MYEKVSSSSLWLHSVVLKKKLLKTINTLEIRTTQCMYIVHVNLISPEPLYLGTFSYLIGYVLKQIVLVSLKF